MEMQASRQLAVTQQQAWDALNDPEVLKVCIPGCDKVEASGENQYAIGMALKIGPVSAKFKGNIELSDINPPASYKLSFEGQGGPAGHGKGSAAVVLTPNAAGCELAYTVQASVGGKVAQLGQRLIDGAPAGVTAADAVEIRRLAAGGAGQHAFRPRVAMGPTAGGGPGRCRHAVRAR